MRCTWTIAVLTASALLWGAPPVAAQYSVLQSPFNTASDSFYENVGVGFGFNGGGGGGAGGGAGFFFNNGGGGAVPPFGGYDPAADATFGFRAGPFLFNLRAGQGASRTITSQTPIVVVPNGGVGTVTNILQRPFVTGIVPIVGDNPIRQRWERMQQEGAARPATAGSPGDDAPLALGGGNSSSAASSPPAASTAQQGDLSLAEIRRQQAQHDAAQLAEMEQLAAKAAEYEAAGRPGVAQAYYRMALSRADDANRSLLEEKIRELDIARRAAN